MLRGGVQWRMLPADFPSWKLVYYYFKVWSKFKKLVETERTVFGRNNKTSFGVIDSKSVKNADTAE